ncbi:hypothetical protein TVAG_198440 [Trichomonas vaginalis G3]|uniref:Uncharacterized protein n=1 Tax=Trichomonas vaginalis (strain ATCC PRA-98 / G3) TaxID=412133 RepID=A2DDN0_TRIV3|nr:hypothetical protein TVAGG3_0998860 [Trichomonas vaginalis G3]EAY21406.1 hypothetical protein TVAG_198440 [Trichomonas vaginalis G3]KAI5490619.1 hypothetical protein TVAGG3_0998860 [Trichomonas vaginalis G3]|eukprot:XP_001582392.1 hypothetical protein [Trichomonas vaginalis G3]
MSSTNVFYSNNWQDSRLLSNNEIDQFLNNELQENLESYLELFDIKPSFDKECTHRFKPVFISQDLHSTINVVVAFGFLAGSKPRGILFFHLKVENVNSIITMLDLFTTNNISNCISKYNIKIIRQVPYRLESILYFSTIISGTRELPYIFDHIDAIQPGDRLFYSFNEFNLQYDCYRIISILSTDCSNQVTIRNFRGIKDDCPPFSMLLKEGYSYICSFFTKLSKETPSNAELEQTPSNMKHVEIEKYSITHHSSSNSSPKREDYQNLDLISANDLIPVF